MRESISITTIFQIVILFILLFTAIMALTINNSNAFGISDEVISIIEHSRGVYLDEFTGGLSEEIIASLSEASYRTTGKCPSEPDGYQGYDRAGNPTSGDDASVCIRTVDVNDSINRYLESELGSGNVGSGDFVSGKYYQVIVFYQLDLPIIKQIYNFQTKGETKIIYQN